MSSLHFMRQGQGPTIVFSHALGSDLHMWDEVANALQDQFTVLRYDARGHGRSPAPQGAYTMNDLADDAAALIRAQCDGPVHFVGLSMGGMTAQAVAAHHPECLASLTIANSASHYDDDAKSLWSNRAETVRQQGTASLADTVMQRWFTEGFRNGQTPHGPDRVAVIRRTLEGTEAESYALACGAIGGIDFQTSNALITCPTMVIAGTRDAATPPALSLNMRHAIPGAQLAEMDTAHLSAVEQPTYFARLVERFVLSVLKTPTAA